MLKGEQPQRPDRLERLQQAAQSDCVCGGHWRNAVAEVLRVQGLEGVFPAAIYRALESGRSKGCNVWFAGETNRGKSLVLSALVCVYDVFENPAEGSFNLENLPGKDCVFLDDFRVEESLFPWRGGRGGYGSRKECRWGARVQRCKRPHRFK